MTDSIRPTDEEVEEIVDRALEDDAWGLGMIEPEHLEHIDGVESMSTAIANFSTRRRSERVVIRSEERVGNRAGLSRHRSRR